MCIHAPRRFPITSTSAFSTTSRRSCCCCCCCCRGVHTATPRDLKFPFRYARRWCPRLYSHRRTLAAVPLKRRRLFGIISGVPHHRKHGLRRRSVFHVRQRCTLAALVSSSTTPLAELCGASVAVATRTFAPETRHRILRFPGSRCHRRSDPTMAIQHPSHLYQR